MAELAASPRRTLVRRAMLLEASIITYNIVEGILAVAAGIAAGSVVLIGFGLDSGIEVSAALVVLYHLSRSHEEEQPEWERRAAMFVGATLLALSVYVVGRSVYALVTQSEPSESYLGLGITLVSLVVMPTVSRLQHNLAGKINSLALEADSKETLVCTLLSGTAVLGLGANALFGWWWADPVAALVMVFFIAREGWEAFTRKELICVD